MADPAHTARCDDEFPTVYNDAQLERIVDGKEYVSTTGPADVPPAAVPRKRGGMLWVAAAMLFWLVLAAVGTGVAASIASKRGREIDR